MLVTFHENGRFAAQIDASTITAVIVVRDDLLRRAAGITDPSILLVRVERGAAEKLTMQLTKAELDGLLEARTRAHEQALPAPLIRELCTALREFVRAEGKAEG